MNERVNALVDEHGAENLIPKREGEIWMLGKIMQAEALKKKEVDAFVEKMSQIFPAITKFLHYFANSLYPHSFRE